MDLSLAESNLSRGVAAHYGRESGAAYSAWQLRSSAGRQSSLNFVPYVASTDRVLDFGCGGGSVLVELRCAARYGVEPNPASRIVAIERGVVCEENLDGFPSDTFDTVISNHALEHCLQPFRELEGIERVLRPGGTFVLVVPSEEWRAQPRYDPSDHNHHLFTWTPLSIGHLVSEAGFAVVSVTLKRSAWPPGMRYLARLPDPVFATLCAVWSRIVRRQEIVVVARRARRV